jgi:hypothetical protein
MPICDAIGSSFWGLGSCICTVPEALGHLGVRAGDLPSVGPHGAPLLRNDVSLPADADVRLIYELLDHTFPYGTLDVDDYSNVGTTGAPDGLHYMRGRTWADGEPTGDVGQGPGVSRAIIAIGTAFDPGPAPSRYMAAGARRIASGTQSPVKLAALDVDETDDVLIDWAPGMRRLLSLADLVASVQADVESREGLPDPAARLMLVGGPLIGPTWSIQRVRGMQAGTTYLLRFRATLAPSGLVLLATGFVKCVRKA